MIYGPKGIWVDIVLLLFTKLWIDITNCNTEEKISINGIDKFDISTQTGHTNTNVTFIKTVISISANYTKDAILQSTICEHTNSTTDEDISFLNNFDKFPSLIEHKKKHIFPAQITTDEIIYAFENTTEPFVEFTSDQEVSWYISGGLDKSKFILNKTWNDLTCC